MSLVIRGSLPYWRRTRGPHTDAGRQVALGRGAFRASLASSLPPIVVNHAIGDVLVVGRAASFEEDDWGVRFTAVLHDARNCARLRRAGADWTLGGVSARWEGTPSYVYDGVELYDSARLVEMSVLIGRRAALFGTMLEVFDNGRLIGRSSDNVRASDET